MYAGCAPRGGRVYTSLASWQCRHVSAEPHVYLDAGNSLLRCPVNDVMLDNRDVLAKVFFGY
jgi:hypothetical protein